MSNTLVRFLLIVVVFFLVSGQRATAQHRCDNHEVTYEPFDRSYEDRMMFETGSLPVRVQSPKKWSPQRTRWMSVLQPDFPKPGPWTSVVWSDRKS